MSALNNDLIMSNSAKRATPSRNLKHRLHRRRARFWAILLVVAIGLFPITLLFTLAPLSIAAMFVDEVFINQQYARAAQYLQRIAASLIWAPAIIGAGWWMLRQISVAKNKHRRLAAGYAQSSAEEVLAKARSDGHNFGLFLRGFEAEVASAAYKGPNPEISSREADVYARNVEALLVEMLDENLPLVALADPGNPEPMAGVYRFERVPQKWEQFICELLPDAFPIVMHLTSFTPGIMFELDVIGSPLYSSKVVIIVSRSLAIRNSRNGAMLLRFLSRYGHIIFEQIDEGWSREQEREFHRRLQESFRALERNSQDRQIIMKKGAGNFTVVTPSRFSSVINFIKGPALGVSILMALVIVIRLLFPVRDVDNLGGGVGEFIRLWLIGIIVLSALKGVTYILGFAEKYKIK